MSLFYPKKLRADPTDRWQFPNLSICLLLICSSIQKTFIDDLLCARGRGTPMDTGDG